MGRLVGRSVLENPRYTKPFLLQTSPVYSIKRYEMQSMLSMFLNTYRYHRCNVYKNTQLTNGIASSLRMYQYIKPIEFNQKKLNKFLHYIVSYLFQLIKYLMLKTKFIKTYIASCYIIAFNKRKHLVP